MEDSTSYYKLKEKNMARFKTKKIDFDQASVPGDVVAHRVYHEIDRRPDYASAFDQFTTDIDPIIPDDILNFPIGPIVYVGVTAINSDGHESDMGMITDPFVFVAPPVPIFQVVDA